MHSLVWFVNIPAMQVRRKFSHVKLWGAVVVMLTNKWKVRCRQEALSPTSTARARMKQWNPVPGGAGLLESIVGLRTGCPVHQLFINPRKTIWWMAFVLTWDSNPLALALIFNSWWFWISPSVLGCKPSLWNIVVNEINLVQMSLTLLCWYLVYWNFLVIQNMMILLIVHL